MAPRPRHQRHAQSNISQGLLGARFGLGDHLGDRQPIFKPRGVDQGELLCLAGKGFTSAPFDHRCGVLDRVDLPQHHALELFLDLATIFLKGRHRLKQRVL